MVRVQTHVQTRCRVVVLILLELGRMETHMRQDRASVVHGNHANAILVEDQAHLHQHRLQPLGEDPNRGRLHCLGNHQVVGHLSMLAMSSESRITQFATRGLATTTLITLRLLLPISR